MKSVCGCLLLASALLFTACVGEDWRRLSYPGAILATSAGPVEKPRLLAAETPQEAGEQLTRFFSHIGSKGLAALQQDADTTLALQAAWLLALGPGDEKEPPCPQRFVRFFESRTGVKVPLRWEYSVVMTGFNYSPDHYRLQTAAQREYLHSCAFLAEEVPGKEKITYCPQEIAKTSLGLSAPVGTRIERKNGKIVIQIGKATVEVRESGLPKEILAGNGACIALIGPERSFIALHDGREAGSFFPLLCVDSHSGEVLWQREVWGTAYRGAICGPCYHEPMIVTKDDLIVLFGNGDQVYAEAFDAKSGNPAFRFCPDQWFFGSTDDLETWRRSLWRFRWR